MRPVSPRRQLAAVLVEDLAASVPSGGLPGRAGGGAQVGGRGDRGPRDLGRAVEVVEDVAELVHELQRELARQRGAARRGTVRSDEVSYLLRTSSGRSRIRWSITGTIGHDGALVLRDRRRASPRGRTCAGARTSSASASPSVKCAKPHEWNSGAAMIVRSPALQRDPREERDRAGSRPSGCLRVRALRRAGRARGEDDDAAGLGGRDRRLGVAGLDQLLERRVGRRVVLDPGDEALAALAGVLEQLGELLVVDDRRGLLALRPPRSAAAPANAVLR